MSAMKASCFGHLFSIPDLKFQGQLHNMLLRRLVNSSLNHHLLSFNINGRNLDFRPFDFCIITGLKFGPAPTLPVESDLHRRVFGSKCSITVEDIEKSFKAECRASAGCSELSLKLAFVLILFVQVWAYEVIPVVAHNCVQKIECALNCFPRILRWIATKPIKFDIVHTYFRNVKPEHLHAQSVECGGSQPQTTDAVEDSVGAPLVFESRPIVNTNVNDPVVANLQRRVVKLEKSLYEMKKSREVEIDSKRIKRPGLRAGARPGQIESTKTTLKPHTPKRSKKVAQGKRCSNLRMPQLRRPHLLCSPNPYDPNEAEYMPDHVNAFANWVEKAKISPVCFSLKLPIYMAPSVDALWFDRLWDRDGWLRSDHIDALLKLLIIMAKKEPGRFLHGWTLMEMICWVVPFLFFQGAPTQENYCIVSDRVGPDVRGAYPRQAALDWYVASAVYGVGNLNDDHWVCYEISFEEKRITEYDSMSKSKREEDVLQHFRLFCRNVELLCLEVRVWEMKRLKELGNREWEVELYKHPPQQTNGADCGVMALKYIECMVSGNIVEYLIPGRCGVFRQSYCGKLHSLGTESISGS
ncbi:hypothetical protein C2S53_018453 [Perilla frutescens var. hirtella]|uniref:Ubiquitin-like protease family profile domain-containing protein n=1 Tax=Perilla frutescens var. hirtella TaxID=608512 RepID=A0AAD4J0U5_PERFH|nr:hypothetical protein C2S53_018453 [Perilla frutescens var. hirtella]